MPDFVAIEYSLNFSGMSRPSKIAIAVLSDKVSLLRISITLLIKASFLSLSTANVNAIETQFWVLCGLCGYS